MSIERTKEVVDMAIAGNEVIYVIFNQFLVDVEFSRACTMISYAGIAYEDSRMKSLIKTCRGSIRFVRFDEARKMHGIRGAVVFDEKLESILNAFQSFMHCELGYQRIGPTGIEELRP